MLCLIYVCLLVTTCDAERSFSMLWRLHTYMRNSQSQERLTIHRELTHSMEIHPLIEFPIIYSGGSSMGLAPHLNFCQPHQLAPSAKLVYYIYLTSTTRLLLRRSMNIKLSNYLIPQLRIDYDGKLVIIDRLWEGSPLL